MKTCEITCGDSGKFNGQEHYWACGKPAKATIKKRPGPGVAYVCGTHARVNDRLAEKYKHIEKSKPITT